MRAAPRVASVSLAAIITNTNGRIPPPVGNRPPSVGAPLANPLAAVTAVVGLQLRRRQLRSAYRALFDLGVWHPVVRLHCTLDKFW